MGKIVKFNWKNPEHLKALFWRIIYNTFKAKKYGAFPLLHDYYELDETDREGFID